MPTTNVDILAEINSISKIHTLKSDDIDTIMKEFAGRILKTLHIERLSVWLLNPAKDTITAMGEYDVVSKVFTKGNIIKKVDCPNYFSSLEENEILEVPNVYEHELTKELVDDYFKPYNIISLIDVPLRIDGNVIGVMCYEKVGDVPRVFTDKDKLFVLSIGLVFASNLEARQRRAVQSLLDEELREKEILIKEINHRVKNNISVISSLLNMQVVKSKDDFHKALFEECKSKVDAIASIHRITQSKDDFGLVNIQEFVEDLIQDLLEFHASVEIKLLIAQEIESILITIDQAVPLALIINEVITNAYKHAFPHHQEGLISVNIVNNNENVEVTISDNGIGIDKSQIREGSMGIEIIEGLCEQLDGVSSFNKNNGTVFNLTFPRIQSL